MSLTRTQQPAAASPSPTVSGPNPVVRAIMLSAACVGAAYYLWQLLAPTKSKQQDASVQSAAEQHVKRSRKRSAAAARVSRESASAAPVEVRQQKAAQPNAAELSAKFPQKAATIASAPSADSSVAKLRELISLARARSAHLDIRRVTELLEEDQLPPLSAQVGVSSHIREHCSFVGGRPSDSELILLVCARFYLRDQDGSTLLMLLLDALHRAEASQKNSSEEIAACCAVLAAKLSGESYEVSSSHSKRADGKNELHVVCGLQSLRPHIGNIIEVLLDGGVGLNSRDAKGWTPLLLFAGGLPAEEAPHGSHAYLTQPDPALGMLIDYGADPNISNHEKENLLHLLVKMRQNGALEYILSRNYPDQPLDVFARNVQGHTPLQLTELDWDSPWRDHMSIALRNLQTKVRDEAEEKKKRAQQQGAADLSATVKR